MFNITQCKKKKLHWVTYCSWFSWRLVPRPFHPSICIASIKRWSEKVWAWGYIKITFLSLKGKLLPCT